jgi:hypothetical protein
MYLAYNIDQLWAFTSQFKLLGELVLGTTIFVFTRTRKWDNDFGKTNS